MSELSLDAIRKQLQSWEQTYKEINGRKPTKSAVDTAPANIRLLYSQYSQLRNGGIRLPSQGSGSEKNFSAPRLKRDNMATEKPLYSVPSRLKSANQLNSPSSSSKSVPETDHATPIFCGITPKYCDQLEGGEQVGQDNFPSYFRSVTPDEIAVKRRNFSNLATIDLDDDETEADGEGETTDANRSDNEDDATETNKAAPCRQRRPKKSNPNFVRLDMKHRRYCPKISKGLKGAALKRFLFKKFRK